MGRALLLGRRRRWAGMLRIASPDGERESRDQVAGLGDACRPGADDYSSPLRRSEIAVTAGAAGHKRSLASVRSGSFPLKHKVDEA